jgi:hypothetical protein
LAGSLSLVYVFTVSEVCGMLCAFLLLGLVETTFVSRQLKAHGLTSDLAIGKSIEKSIEGLQREMISV